MGKRVDIPESAEWKSGEDKTHRISVTSDGTTPVNMTGFSLVYEIKNDIRNIVASALVSVTPTLDSDAGTNDRALCAVADTDTTGLDGVYWYILRRTDAGSEGMLAYGKVPIRDVGLG